jgi:hypothetical protein
MSARQKAEEVCGRLVVCGMDGFGRKLGRLGICDNEALKEAAHVCVCVRSAQQGTLVSQPHRTSSLSESIRRLLLSPAHDLISRPRN